MNEYTSQELSQRLHDKGFRAEHHAAWVDQGDCGFKLKRLCNCNNCSTRHHGHIPAYTFTELWAVVPWKIEDSLYDYGLFIDKAEDGMCLMSYTDIDKKRTIGHIMAHSIPAEALGLLVEWLIDNGHMEVS